MASQIPLQNLKRQFALNNLPLHKSHSIKKFAANALQKSDNKECEKSKQKHPKLHHLKHTLLDFVIHQFQMSP